MTGLPRFALKPLNSITTLALAAALSLPAALLAQEATTTPVVAPTEPAAAPTPAATPTPAPTGAAPAGAGAAAAAEVSPELKTAVESFWHYGKVARYDLANTEGQKIIAAGADPEAILRTFEATASARGDNLDEWLIRWQRVDPMKDITGQLVKVISDGYRARRSSPAFILEQINRLGVNERAYGLGMSRLRESGELAVPFMIEILRDPAKKNMTPLVRRALRDLGQYSLNPLVASTEMKDWDTLTVIVGVLGDLGYPGSAPYIARLLESDETPAAVKGAATDALSRLGVGTSLVGMKSSDLFYDLGEKFYYNQSSIVADSRWPTANIWYWGANGLERKEVPHQIYNDLMAMRSAEYTLKQGGARSDDALSLWLAANYKREADLPEGEKDATRPDNYPPGHYWGVSGGAKYLEPALARAIKDRNAAVAYRATRSLQEIVGQSNLVLNSAHPLVRATQFPDRKVRFESAFALAEAMPQSGYEGAQRVVPLLAEALAQTGQPSVLVVMPSQDEANKLVDGLKGVGFAAAGATTAEAAANVAVTLPAVDVLVVSEDLGAGNIDNLFIMANENARLAGAARLVMVKTAASMYEPRKVTEPLLSTTTATDAAGLKSAIEAARAKAGALPMDPAVATDYATRAGNLMLKIGASRQGVYPLAPAKPTLLAALSDARPDIVKLSGQVLGWLNDKEAQSGLLAAASDEKAADDVKISLYKSLATNARNYGNMLESNQIDMLEKVVADATNLDVRSAAAEARGALNLPADQAKKLIVQQSKV
ncbi:MAG TPA: hypothetical protein VH518_20700 [Tepidisphaeraceae bacterium]|jgi:hypothetical protein